ncbi:MAG: dienelactone hydrolase family protein [Gammaproteobacteria bacterium]|jgi:pimeloyl-ACP methyl ester carboxylesterase
MKYEDVVIPADDVFLEGQLTIPEGAVGLVAFVHGSGSSRFSVRNQKVAGELNEAGFATLLFDLLSPEEHERDVITAEYRFSIPLLARRMGAAIEWLDLHDSVHAMPVGLFGASTGAAAALIVAADHPGRVKAVVSRGGRPDLAEDALERVHAPTLLVVGGNDGPVIRLNRDAATHLACEHQLVIVPGASHLFEEPGKLDEVSELAADWFHRFLAPHPRLAQSGKRSAPGRRKGA